MILHPVAGYNRFAELRIHFYACPGVSQAQSVGKTERIHSTYAGSGKTGSVRAVLPRSQGFLDFFEMASKICINRFN